MKFQKRLAFKNLHIEYYKIRSSPRNSANKKTKKITTTHGPCDMDLL